MMDPMVLCKTLLSKNIMKIAFISDRDTSSQAYIMDMSGGDAKKLTDMENGISYLSWSPSGKHLAFVSDVKMDRTVQEIYDEVMDWADEKENVSEDVPMASVGYASLGGGAYTHVCICSCR